MRHVLPRWIDRGALCLVLCWLLALPLLFRPYVAGVDAVGYYSWLRSAVIDHDLDVANEFDHFATQDPRTAAFGTDGVNWVVTPTGYRHNQWAAGSALLWLPLYAVTHGVVLLADATGAPIAADGYSWPYQLAAALMSTLCALAATLLTYRLARRLGFTAAIAAPAAAGAWLASPLLFYSFSNPLMSHACDALAFALIVTALDASHTASPLRGGLAIGLAVGLATWIRTQNLLFLVVPLGLALIDAFAQRRAAVTHIAGILLGFGLLFAPLMLFWKTVYGGWLVNTYAATSAPGYFDWRAPHLVEIFFSTNRGLFVWSPIMLLALAGLWWLWQLDRRLTAALLLMFAIQVYLIAGLRFWSGAPAFGARYLSNMLMLYGLGLAALYARLRWPRWAPAAVTAAFIGWNGLLLVQYALETVPRAGPVDLVALVQGQFRIIPDNLTRLLRVLVERR